MEKVYYYFFVSIVLQLYFLEAFIATNINTDESALLALKARVTLDSSHPMTQNWTSQASVCDWIGVTCGSRHHRVTALNVSNMNIRGTIPQQLGNLSFLVSLDMRNNSLLGDLPQDLFRLRRLKYMNLRNNSLNGTIPPDIVNLERLQFLSLSLNNLQGTIPTKIGNLRNLQKLQLRGNKIVGSIPHTISNMSSLYHLNLDSNNLTGVIPREIGNLHKLELLYLGGNELSGAIPEVLFNISTLKEVDLAFNNLSGTIPTNIGNLRNLQKLQLWGNKIVGSIPHTISNMSSLYHLDLDSNNLTGVIPREIGNLHKLERLYLGGNELSGAIPEVLFNISSLKVVDLAYNNLSGSLPCYWQTNLQILHLHVNNIGGVIPTSISNSSNLKELLLFHNKFSGKIPNSLGDLRQLEDLELFQNNLSSSPHDQSIFTSLTNCRSLRLIAFNENPLNDELPDSIGNLSTSLEQFYLYDSEISGKIPLGIGNLTNLIMLNLFGNDLTGSMPGTLCDLQNIQRLDLHNNKLSGTIPECLCKLPGLEGVFLYENQISGPIPYCIGNVTSLRYIYLESNRLTTNIPMSIWSLKDVLELDLSDNSLVGSLNPNFGNLIAMTMLNLSRNKLSGSIPATVGELQKLNYLSLAYNELEGSIPESLGNMISLETLDLSNNMISGVIPKSLEALKYLEDFNVSFNRLEGEIPSLNFTTQSFMGNKELCGGLLFRPCKAKFFHQSRKRKLLLIILVPLAISLMGLCLIVVFVLKRRGNRNVPTQVDQSLLENITPARISYNEIERATQGFDQCNLLGSGGFGSVYKGRFENGMVLAIKVFSLQFEGAFKSFDRECEILRNLRHRNLIKVITSCTNMDFKALLLEYMPNGSLEEWLYSDDNFFLDINQRLDIMIDVASALDYLHHGYSTVVVHCDLKPSNVLLDERLVGHVSDFGLAKLLGEGETKAHTTTLATMGYIAPEYGSTGLVSTSCDVYSYGIMLMETFTRKRPQDEMFQENLNMRSWVCNSLAAAAIADIVDSTLVEPEETGFNKMLHCVSSILELALNCTVESPSERLNMKVILANIKDIKLEFLCK